MLTRPGGRGQCSVGPRAGAGRSGRSCSPSGCAAGRRTGSSRPTSCPRRTTTGCRAGTADGSARRRGRLRHRRHHRVRLAHGPRRPALAARGLLRRSRASSLLALDAVLAPGIEPGMWVFIVFYGLDWVATVPPTMALCRTHFGLRRLQRGLRVGVRVPHGRCRGRGERRGVGPHEPGRLPLGLAGGRRALLRRRGGHAVDPPYGSRHSTP